MANKMISNIKTLTTGVEGLVKNLDKLYATLNKVNSVSTSAISKASSVVGTVGGSYGLTQGSNRPGTGADGARFADTPPGGRGNILQNSLAPFSFMGGGYPGYGEYGPSRFPYPGYPQIPGMTAGGVAKANLLGAAVKFGTGVVAGAYDMIPGLEPTLQRTFGYYRAGLTSPGINRNQLERATFSGMRGGLSEVGGDAQVAFTLASMGYTPGSANYMRAVGQVGGAFNYLGMGNAAAAQAVAGFQTGPMAANLFQYGITTTDASGREKTTGQLARELMGYMTGGAKISVEDVRRSYQKGALGANLANMGFSQEQQTLLYQGMIDIASGRNPDLQTASPVKGNENTFLTAQGRLNTSTTGVMMAAEEKMIKGFENAADAVEAFNRQVMRIADELGYVKGFAEGTSGTPAGKGGGRILKNIGGALLIAGGAAVSTMSFGGATPIGIGMAMKGATMLGGGTTGFGASFGVGNRGKTGGSSPAAGAGVAAGYGATDTTASSPWSSTNGSHTGIDYEMPIGTPVKSAFDGVVSAVNINADYGTSIMVENVNGTQAIYGHLSEKRVKVGDQIRQGQVIGKSGESGNANGPHLHFEIRDGKNNPVDPKPFLSSDNYAGKLFGNYASTIPTYNDLIGGSGTGASNSSIALRVGAYTGSQKGLSNADLRSTLEQAGFKGSALETAMAVARAESGGIPGRHSHPSLLKDDSYGLFQINMLGDLGTARNAKYLKEYGQYGYTGPQSLYDPLINARIAYDISKGGTNWSDAWVNTSKKLGIGGATTGYGASMPSNPISSGNKTVNITLKIERASEQDAIIFAKKVKSYLENDNETSMIGRS